MSNSKINTCKTCKFWKNQQAELEYNVNNGICVHSMLKFTATNYTGLKLLDRANPSGKHMNVNRFESVSTEIPFGVVDKSRYCLVTDDGFGCIHHTSK